MSAEDGKRGLESRYPGREAQIRLLVDLLRDVSGQTPAWLHSSHSLLGQPRQPSPGLVHLYDPNSPASTWLLLQDVIVAPTVVVAVDPLLCPTSRSLFAHLLTALGTTFSVGDSLDLFLGALSKAVESKVAASGKVILVLRRAERARSMWPEPVVEALFNLAETVSRTCPQRPTGMLTRASQISARGVFTLATISTLPTSHFRTVRGVGMTDALVVSFPRLSKHDAIASLSLDAERLIQSDERHSASQDSLVRLHAAFVGVAYDSFASEIRDLEKIRLLACCVWYPFVEPMFSSDVPATRPQALLSRSGFLFREALSRLHTNEMAPADWVAQMVKQVRDSAHGVVVERRHPAGKGGSQLAHIPTFLLLASFLASYNPARLDVRYFVRDESALLPEARGLRAGRKRKRTVRRGGGAGSRNRQEMLGPKTFALDRLLSIFQALITEAGPEVQGVAGEEDGGVKSDWWEVKSKSIAVMEAVNCLVRMGFVVRTSAAERLEGTTLLRTNVTFEDANQLSRRARFSLDEWLWDWNQ